MGGGVGRLGGGNYLCSRSVSHRELTRGISHRRLTANQYKVLLSDDLYPVPIVVGVVSSEMTPPLIHIAGWFRVANMQKKIKINCNDTANMISMNTSNAVNKKKAKSSQTSST